MRYLGSSASCVPTADLIVCLDCWDDTTSLSRVSADEYVLYHRRDDKSEYWALNAAEITKLLLCQTGENIEMYRYAASNRRHLLPQELVTELVARELTSCDT